MSASVGWIPGTWRVPVSLQSHAREPPGKSLASLYSPAAPVGKVHVVDGFRLWGPINSMLLVSVVLSVLLWVVRRLL